MILGMIVGSTWFVLFLLGHVAILRLVPAVAKPRANQLMFFIGLLGLPAALWPLIAYAQNPVLTQGGFALATLCGVLVYVGLFVLYMPFYYVVAASLSVRTAVLLNRRLDGTLPLSVLQNEFASPRLVEQRLETMVENGFLWTTPRGFGLTAKGKWIARVFDFIKGIWRLGTGG